MLQMCLRQVRRFRGVALTATLVLVTAWLVFAAMGLRVTSHAKADPELAGTLRRAAANFLAFNGDEIFTNVDSAPGAQGGLTFYDQSIAVPGDVDNIVYVTVSAVGDSHNSARVQIACVIDSAPCNPGTGGAGEAPSGWITVNRHHNYNLNYAPGGTPFNGDGSGGAGDVHDNTIYYTWCAQLQPSPTATHNVKLRLGRGAVSSDPASAGPNGVVFMENVHVFVDTSLNRDPSAACVAVANPSSPSSASPHNR